MLSLLFNFYLINNIIKIRNTTNIIMSLCIYDIQKDKITSPAVAFIAPSCQDCIISYILTTQNHCLKITPDFSNVTFIDLDTNTESIMTLELFCSDFLDPLNAIVVCTDVNETASIKQLANDIQIFKADSIHDADDVIYQNDTLDHGKTCNSIHWHYQRTVVSVNKNCPLLANLPHRQFVACYLAKARFTDMAGLNLNTLNLSQEQYVNNIKDFCSPQSLGLLPWCSSLPNISSSQLKKISSWDWYVGFFTFALVAVGTFIVYMKYRDRVTYC